MARGGGGRSSGYRRRDGSETVIAKRASQVEHLLENAGDTGHPEAETDVKAALSAARELLERLDEPSS